MKKLIFLILLALVALPITVKAQADAYGLAGGGLVLKSDASPAWSFNVGANVPIKSDPAGGFYLFNRTQYWYVDGPDDIQALSTYLMTQKTVLPWLSAAIGSGFVQDFKDGGDEQFASFKLEFGANLYKQFGVALGGDFAPLPGADQWTVYGLVDLAP